MKVKHLPSVDIYLLSQEDIAAKCNEERRLDISIFAEFSQEFLCNWHATSFQRSECAAFWNWVIIEVFEAPLHIDFVVHHLLCISSLETWRIIVSKPQRCNTGLVASLHSTYHLFILIAPWDLNLTEFRSVNSNGTLVFCRHVDEYCKIGWRKVSRHWDRREFILTKLKMSM